MNILLKNFKNILRFFEKSDVFVSNGGLMIGVGRWGDGSKLDTVGSVLFFSDNVIV